MLVAFDDTDSATGGCTTHMVFRALLAVPELALGGMPRLVRLNPNVPFKTRGNAAVVLHLVRPEGPQTRVGELQGHEILAFPEGPAADLDPEALQRIWDAVEAHSRHDASPALAATDGPLPAVAYREAVTAMVEPKEARALLEASGAVLHARGDQGLVGCAAALAWPGPPTSYEFIAYRDPRHIGSPRQIEPGPLQALDARGDTFQSHDPAEGDLACVPNTPCPVLVGLRGTDPDRLMRSSVLALLRATQEPVDGWLLFATNQASGDHVVKVADLREARPFQTIRLACTIADLPKDRQGGHVFVAANDSLGNPCTLAAFEPTKSFRKAVRALRPGDRIEATGAFQEDTLRLESFRCIFVAEVMAKVNPTCPQCRKVMKSRGKDAGYRCRHGHGDAPESAATHEVEARELKPGTYEVPVMARRHLHRPAHWPPKEGLAANE